MIGRWTSSVRGKSSMSIEKRIDLRVGIIRNKQQTGSVNIKRCDGGVLWTTQHNYSKNGVMSPVQ